MHQSLHKERGSHLLSPVVWWDWLLLRSPGVFRQQPDPRTTVWLPGAKSSNDRALPLKQSQGHRGPERTAKTRVLRGMEEASQFLYYSEVCWGLSIYLSSTVIILFKCSWRRSFRMDMSFWNACGKCISSEVITGQRFKQVIVQDDSVVDCFSPYILLWHDTASGEMWWEWQPEHCQWKKKRL